MSKLCQEYTESETMARPLKDGVDYFPKDTDFYADDKVRLLRAEFEAKGMYLLDYILCDIYGKKGYYMEWDRNKCFLVSDGAGCGCSPKFTEEFIRGCVRCSFFEKGVFDAFRVLTSKGIQRRFIRMLSSRENFTFIKEYFLLDMSDKKDVPTGILNKVAFKSVSFKENSVKSKGNPDKSKGNSESRLEENRIDYSKEEEERKELSSASASADKNNSRISKALELYRRNIGKVTRGIENKLGEYLRVADISLIEYAIEEAVKYEKRSWQYIVRIIDSKLAQGIHCRADAEKARSGNHCKETAISSIAARSKFNNYTDTNDVDYSNFAENALDNMMNYEPKDNKGGDDSG